MPRVRNAQSKDTCTGGTANSGNFACVREDLSPHGLAQEQAIERHLRFRGKMIAFRFGRIVAALYVRFETTNGIGDCAANIGIAAYKFRRRRACELQQIMQYEHLTVAVLSR